MLHSSFLGKYCRILQYCVGEHLFLKVFSEEFIDICSPTYMVDGFEPLTSLLVIRVSILFFPFSPVIICSPF